MDLDLSEQRLVRERMRDFAVRRIGPSAAEGDETAQFAYSLLPELAETGVFGLPLPEEYGGLGADTLTFARAASVAKLFASEAAMRAANHAVQIHGGYGFMEESTANRLFRDAKILEIGEGTSEIQRTLIARLHLQSAKAKRS